MNFAHVPEWAWYALAAGAAWFLYKNGWFDNLLKQAPKPQSPTQAVTIQSSTSAPVTPELLVEGKPNLTLKGPIKLTIPEGRIDVSA